MSEVKHLQKDTKTFCGIPIDEKHTIEWKIGMWKNRPVRTISWHLLKTISMDDSKSLCKKCVNSLENQNMLFFSKIINFVKRRIYGYDQLVRIATNEADFLLHQIEVDVIREEVPSESNNDSNCNLGLIEIKSKISCDDLNCKHNVAETCTNDQLFILDKRCSSFEARSLGGDSQ